MPCKLKVISGVVDGSVLEYFCDSDDEAYAASATFHCEASNDVETWDHPEIALPARKRKTLRSECLSYAVSATVAIFTPGETTVKVMARITPPAGEARESVVCTVKGKNGTVEFPRLLILMNTP